MYLSTLVNDVEYPLILKAKHAGTITSLVEYAISAGVAGTYTVKVNTTGVTGLEAIANATALTETNATAANTFAIGDRVVFIPTGTTAVVGMTVQLSYTRVL